MAPVVTKRPQKSVFQKPRKRQRIGEAAKPTDAKLGTVSPDSLPWNEVTLPDRLDDAEGFFGLEEVEDVEVLKDSISGKAEFRVGKVHQEDLTTKGFDAHSRQVLRNTGRRNVNAAPAHDATRQIQIDEETEWDGFESEDPNNTQPLNAAKVKRRKAGASDRPQDQGEALAESRKRHGDTLENIGNGSVLGNTFQALGEVTEEEADVSAWEPLHLSLDTLSALARLQFATPTPIQRAAIPEILGGHDLIGKASTGSGKTLAFGIPIFERYLKHSKAEYSNQQRDSYGQRRFPIALILSPTRELAHQLSAHLADFCTNSASRGPRITTLTGGLSVHKQQRLLNDADIIVGTPGRLWEIINGSSGLLSRLQMIQFLVLDEADRLLSEGHFKEIDEILNALDRGAHNDEEDGTALEGVDQQKPQRQTLVFSATFRKDLQQKLAGKAKSVESDIMNKQESLDYLLKRLNFREEKPNFVDVNPVSQMATGLKEGIVECAALEKDLYLYGVLLQYPKARTLIFTNSISSVRRLFPFLQNLNLFVHAIHSEMPQKARLRAIERFSSPSSRGSILIATDVAARGLDIPSIELILHYHIPRTADMYVHRSGRTARAEKSGLSILLCAPEEVQGVQRLVAKVHARNAPGEDDSKTFFMQTIELDRRVISRLKHRADLSKKISDASLAKEKKDHADNWLKSVAEELGVDYDSEEFAANGGSKKGRGSGRKKAEEKARGISKGELSAFRAELKSMLAKRVNVGVSERYLTAGGINVDDLLSGQQGEFLGRTDGGLEMS